MNLGLFSARLPHRRRTETGRRESLHQASVNPTGEGRFDYLLVEPTGILNRLLARESKARSGGSGFPQVTSS
jgi:hypothetical protein